MNPKAVKLSQVGRHPWNSLSPQDHLGTPKRVKFLIKDGGGKSVQILKWMVEEGIVTKDQIKNYGAEIAMEALAPAVRNVDDINKTITKITEQPVEEKTKQYVVYEELWYTSLGFAIAFFGDDASNMIENDSITFDILPAKLKIENRLTDFDVILGENRDENTKQITRYSKALATLWNLLINSEDEGYRFLQLQRN